MSTARRYNHGKPRFELIPPGPLRHLAEVYTRGAHKYTIYVDDSGTEYRGSDIGLDDVITKKLSVKDDGSDNWMKGMSWRSVMASVKRHIHYWEQGQDIDPDPKMGTRHLANAMWGLATLLEYERIAPEYDDRNHAYLKQKKIGLDIDGVLSDFVRHFHEYLGHNNREPTHWNDPVIRNRFQDIAEDVQFWETMPVLTRPEDIPFEPHCYVTTRPIDSDVTRDWLYGHGFPVAPLVSVQGSKVDALKKLNPDIFVDDSFSNFRELNNSGICTFLFDASHNRHYDVGYKRIKTLRDLVVR